MKRKLHVRLLLVGGLGVALIAGAVLLASLRVEPRASRQSGAQSRARRRARAGPAQPGTSRALSSSVMYSLLDQTGALRRRAERAGFQPARRSRSPAPRVAATSSPATGRRTARVTQDCSLRSQAGEQIAVNPLDPNNILVGQNDSRIGYNHCGYAWTLDGGSHWGDETPPFFQVPLLDQTRRRGVCGPDGRLGLARGTPTSRARSSRSAAPENAVVVAKSNAAIHGAFFHSPDSQGGLSGVQRDAAGRGHERGRGLRGQAVTSSADAQRVEPEARLGLRDLDSHRAREGRRRGPSRSSRSCSASPRTAA